jgi:hypothetical protein
MKILDQTFFINLMVALKISSNAVFDKIILVFYSASCT